MTSLPILLPEGYTPTVKSGDHVTALQVIAEKKASSDSDLPVESSAEEVVDLAKQLGLPASKVGKTLKKNPGDSVSVGEVLAANKQGLGFKEVKVISQAEGTVIRFERETGRLIIRLESSGSTPSETDETGNILAPVAGNVTSVTDTQITISTDEKALVGNFGSGKTGEGDLLFAEERPNKEDYILDITLQGAEHILMVPYVTKQLIAKADALGILGLVCLDMAEDVDEYLAQREMVFPLVKFSPEEYKRISKYIGKRILLNGETRSIIVLAS